MRNIKYIWVLVYCCFFSTSESNLKSNLNIMFGVSRNLTEVQFSFYLFNHSE